MDQTKLRNIRIATALADIDKGWLFTRGIPFPDLPIYQSFSARVNRADAGEAYRGVDEVTILWNRIEARHAQLITSWIETVLDANGSIYLTIDRGWDTRFAPDSWVDVSGIPLLPSYQPVAGAEGRVYLNYLLTVRNLTIENNPATGLVL